MLGVRTETIQDACDALLDSDRSIARALSIIGRLEGEGLRGLPTEMMLALGARRTAPDARALVTAARTLQRMTATSNAFSRGELSWSQVRAIVGAVRTVDQDGRARIDALIAFNIKRLARMDPEELVALVDDEVSKARADLARAREDRRIDRGFLAVQNRLDGSATFFGEADGESTATILEALDAAAARPVDPEGPDTPTRAQQRLHALVAMSEWFLAGGRSVTTRPRPRMIVNVDVEALRGTDAEGARILWSMAGHAARITPLTIDVLSCDATVVPVVFDGARPVAVGDAASAITQKMRDALIARDGGCRFPGCGAPVSWCDAHHIRPRINDGPTQVGNLLLLCRKCHRRVHRRRWKVSLRDDGVIEFELGGETWESPPHTRRE